MSTCDGKIRVVRGSKKNFTLDLDKGADPYDLTGATEIKVCAQGESAVVEFTLTAGDLVVTNAALGKISGTMPAAKTTLLAVGEDQNVQVEVVLSGGDPDKKIIQEVLVVEEAIC